MEQEKDINQPLMRNNYKWALTSLLCGLLSPLIFFNIFDISIAFSNQIGNFLFIFSIFLPILALTFGVIALIRKENKIIVILGILLNLGLILFSLIILLNPGGGKAPDARRTSDMRQIISAQEMYYGDTYKYVISTGSEIPSIGTYLPVPPKDPKEPNKHYVWLENNWIYGESCKGGQFFCAYTILDNKGTCKETRYFAASENGSKEICDVVPVYNKSAGDCICY
jgi:hypothetical protein